MMISAICQKSVTSNRTVRPEPVEGQSRTHTDAAAGFCLSRSSSPHASILRRCSESARTGFHQCCAKKRTICLEVLGALTIRKSAINRTVRPEPFEGQSRTNSDAALGFCASRSSSSHASTGSARTGFCQRNRKPLCNANAFLSEH